MIEIIEAVLLIIAISGHSILCFYAGYRYNTRADADYILSGGEDAY